MEVNNLKIIHIIPSLAQGGAESQLENLVFYSKSKSVENIIISLKNEQTSLLNKMKDGVGIINTSHGGVLNEVDLVKAIESGKVKYAGLDVFESEPKPEIQLLMNPEISMTPHIGASTLEAQNRTGIELANKIIELLSE